jgi:hypothetical protein
MSKSHHVNEGPSRDDADRPEVEATPAAEGSGRDALGRFTKGNAGGAGNPFARRVAALRSVLLECVTDKDMEHVACELVVQAKMGNLAAIKLLLQYVIGKPAATVDPDTLDLQEMELFQRGASPEQLTELMGGHRQQPGQFIELLRVLLPVLAQQIKSLFADAILNPAKAQADREDDELADDYWFGDDKADDEDDEEPVAPAAQERRPASPPPHQDTGARQRPAPAPKPAGMSASSRPTATRPSTDGGNGKRNTEAPPHPNGDEERPGGSKTGGRFFPRPPR